METSETPTLLLPEEKKRKSSKRYGTVLFLSFISGLFGGGLAWWAGPIISGKLHFRSVSNVQSVPTWKPSSPESASPSGEPIVELVDRSMPAVVSVVITKDVPKYRNLFDSPGFPFFFGMPFGRDGGNSDLSPNSGGTEKQTIGEGSGFLVSPDGIIVTNKHVVGDTDADYTDILSDKKEYSARILARDPVQDIAILKVDGNNFPFLELGDSDSTRVGQTAIAIGNSLGEFSNTVSRGIVSGLKRSLVAGSGFGSSERLSGIIQTDAAINPGNSGGPLLDLSGKVIGVNVAMAQGAQNIGFAIPAKVVKNALAEVKTTGKISAPFLGVRYAVITPDIQKENNLPFSYGALVVRGQRITDLAVVPGSPADKAGIIENDIILEIDGSKIDEDMQLGDIVGTKRVGDTVALKIWRKGETKDVRITLEERK